MPTGYMSGNTKKMYKNRKRYAEKQMSPDYSYKGDYYGGEGRNMSEYGKGEKGIHKTALAAEKRGLAEQKSGMNYKSSS